MRLFSLTVMLAVAAAGQTVSSKSFLQVKVQLEIVANLESGSAESCKLSQIGRGPQSSWSSVGSAKASANGFDLSSTTIRCGANPPADSTAPAGFPFLIFDISVTGGWDAAAMHPGPGRALQLFMGVTRRQLTGIGPDGKPMYGSPVISRRITRLEPQEEYVLPIFMPKEDQIKTLGFREVLLRISGALARVTAGAEYGTVLVTGTVPGSEVKLDGGLVGHAGTEGQFLITNVPVGRREISIQRPSGGTVLRHVFVAHQRKVNVSPADPIVPSTKLVGKNREGYAEYARSADGATMVGIPEGEFLMGNLQTEGSPLPHRVFVSAFLMDKLPVTVAQYNVFAAASGRPLPPDPYWGVHNNFPVAFVTWDEAKAYCEWAGGRLPTEAEREKATRGTDSRMWPWGTGEPTPDRAVFRRSWGTEGNDAAGQRPAGASPYGLLDTGGNMWEWVEDWWDVDYFKSSPPKDPPGPKTGNARVVKGGSWDSRPSVLSASSRNFGFIGYREGDYGFRCAADPPR